MSTAKKSKTMKIEKMFIEFHNTEVNDLHKMLTFVLILYNESHASSGLSVSFARDGCGLLYIQHKVPEIQPHSSNNQYGVINKKTTILTRHYHML